MSTVFHLVYATRRTALAALAMAGLMSAWNVQAQEKTLTLALARSANSSGLRVPSEINEWQCRSAFRMFTR